MCESVQFFKLKNGQATNFSIFGPLEMELPMTHTHIIKKNAKENKRKSFWLCSFQLWLLFIYYKLKHILIILGTLRLLSIYPRWIQDSKRGKQILHKVSILWLGLH